MKTVAYQSTDFHVFAVDQSLCGFHVQIPYAGKEVEVVSIVTLLSDIRSIESQFRVCLKPQQTPPWLQNVLTSSASHEFRWETSTWPQKQPETILRLRI